MGFELTKGQGFQLGKNVASFVVGLGWNVGDNFDLDASIFGLKGGKLVSEEYGVGFFSRDIKQSDGSFKTNDGAIIHTGDNLTGEGDGDDEVIKIAQDKVNSDVEELAVWITMYDAPSRRQHFGMVTDAFVRVADEASGEEICRYNLGNEFIGCFAVHVGSFLKQGNGAWKFTAVGEGDQVEIGDIIRKYQ